MTAETILSKSVRYDSGGKPLEVVIPYEEFVDFIETHGLDLSEEEKESIREAEAEVDRKAGRMENFVTLEDLEKELSIEVRTIIFHRRAAKYLRKMPTERASQVRDALKEVGALDDIAAHPHSKQLSGDMSKWTRLRTVKKGQDFSRVLLPVSLVHICECCHPNGSTARTSATVPFHQALPAIRPQFRDQLFPSFSQTVKKGQDFSRS